MQRMTPFVQVLSWSQLRIICVLLELVSCKPVQTGLMVQRLEITAHDLGHVNSKKCIEDHFVGCWQAGGQVSRHSTQGRDTTAAAAPALTSWAWSTTDIFFPLDVVPRDGACESRFARILAVARHEDPWHRIGGPRPLVSKVIGWAADRTSRIIWQIADGRADLLPMANGCSCVPLLLLPLTC